MTLLKLILTAAPAVREAVTAILRAFAAKDEKAVRAATEATLLLAFQLRNSRPKK